MRPIALVHELTSLPAEDSRTMLDHDHVENLILTLSLIREGIHRHPPCASCLSRKILERCRSATVGPRRLAMLMGCYDDMCLLRNRPDAKMDHLACFVPGMLALGVSHGAVTGPKAEQYQAVAANMTYTCYQMYKQQPTGELCL